jgi:hypothetical protein
MATLFAKAKKEAPSQGAPAKKSKLVPVLLGDKLRDLQDKRNQIETLKSDCTLLEGEIKPVVRTEWLKIMKQQGRKPDSFVIQSNGSNMLVIVQDKFLTMTETKEKALRDNKLDSFIDEKVTFAFDPVLLDKYEKEISAAIEKIKSISDDEKERLIVPTIVKSVKKGALELLPSLKDKAELAFNLFEPVIQLKNQE